MVGVMMVNLSLPSTSHCGVNLAENHTGFFICTAHTMYKKTKEVAWISHSLLLNNTYRCNIIKPFKSNMFTNRLSNILNK